MLHLRHCPFSHTASVQQLYTKMAEAKLTCHYDHAMKTFQAPISTSTMYKYLCALGSYQHAGGQKQGKDA